VIVEFISGGQVLRLDVSQFIAYNGEGTPVVVAGEYGPRAVKAAHAADDDFNRTMAAFGYGRHDIEAELISAASVPDGAKLLAGPGGTQNG
jgi:hypothetical protein